MKRSFLALALLALLPLSAQAGELSYTYVEGDYLNIDSEADGFGLRGSINFGDSDFYGFGNYGRMELDYGSFDFNTIEAGVGYHYAMTDRAHLLAELAYLQLDTDFGNADGIRSSVGVRGALTGKLEGVLKANYVDGQDFDGDFTGTAGLQYKLNARWGVVGEVEFSDGGGEAYLLGVRASF